MKVIIAGSRNMPETDFYLIEKAVKESGLEITEVVCGKARGADMLGWHWAHLNGVPVKEFPADWKRYGRAAGPIRNKQMAEYGDALIVFLYPGSKGSMNMLLQMNKLGKRCIAVYPKVNP